MHRHASSTFAVQFVDQCRLFDCCIDYFAITHTDASTHIDTTHRSTELYSSVTGFDCRIFFIIDHILDDGMRICRDAIRSIYICYVW